MARNDEGHGFDRRGNGGYTKYMNKCSSVQRKRLPSPDEAAFIVELFKTMGEDTRLALLCRLQEREYQVTELAETTGHTVSAVSHQLRLLRHVHLVRTRREGRNIFYALDDEHVGDLIDVALAHVREKARRGRSPG